MPRKSYEAFRAAKAAGRRRASVVESETDAESLASYSTFQSNSSYRTQHTYPSPRLAPYQPPSHLNPTSSYSATSLPQLHPKHQTFSSSSSSYTPSALTPRLDVPKEHKNDRGALDERKRKEETRRRREGRREEREGKSTLRGETFDSPLRRGLRCMSRMESSRWGLPIGLVAVGVVKTAVGYGGFSGQDAPPRYGDFEAQRHWMEVTIHRPLSEWYTYSADWWLLDYPPLTAYTSWLCGKIGSMLDPSHFALDTSWGQSPPDLVTCMRFSVLSLEGLVWWSAVVAWMIQEGGKGGRSWRSQMTGIMTVLLQPSLSLIDNGHFQYNSVLLGLSLWTVVFLSRDQDVLACIAFSMALCFKQMGLYYAPAIGCYLLGKCMWLGGGQGVLHLVKLGITTITTFLIMFAPWLHPFPGPFLHVVHRMFPFARGIFEDKVANFWCASNVVLKWRSWFTIPGMAREWLMMFAPKLATAATLVALLPTVLIVLYTSLSTRPAPHPSNRPAKKTNGVTTGITVITPAASSLSPPTCRLLLISMFTASLSFFLFSFQVHEKSILLPIMPLTVLMAMRGGKEGGDAKNEVWEVGVLVNNVAVFSMWPLLVRDGQTLQYVVTPVLWNYAIGYAPWSVQSSKLRRGGYVVYTLMALSHLPDLFSSITPPIRYPDLIVLVNVLLSFGVFALAWLWGTRQLIQSAWAIGGLGGDSGSLEASGKKSK